MIDYRENEPVAPTLLRSLYRSVGWTSYSENEPLMEGILAGSLYHLSAWEGEALLGLIRVVGDGVSIAYIQDLLVQPEYQRRGIGRTLLEGVLQRFGAIRQVVLLTDDRDDYKAFYRACGLREAPDLGCQAFVRINALNV